MIRLLDLLIESKDTEASKEAKSKGLDNLGFGRWGKDGKVTHVSQSGKLVPYIKQSRNKKPTRTPKQRDTQDATQSTGGSDQLPTSAQDKKMEWIPPGQSIERPRFHETKGMKEIASAIDATFGKEKRISDMGTTLAAVTSNFGRTSPPKIQIGGEGLKAAESYFNFKPTAVFNADTDTIEISETANLSDITSKPISEWNIQDTTAFQLYIHETLHSTSPRIGGDSYFYNNGLNISIEEGMTEYLAQELTRDSVDKYLTTHKSENINNAGKYNEFVTGIECMAKLGNLDVNQAFREKDGERVRNYIWNAQLKVINQTFEKLELVNSELYYSIVDYITAQWIRNDTIALMEPDIADTILYYHEQFENGTPVDVLSVEGSLAKMFQKK